MRRRAAKVKRATPGGRKSSLHSIYLDKRENPFPHAIQRKSHSMIGEGEKMEPEKNDKAKISQCGGGGHNLWAEPRLLRSIKIYAKAIRPSRITKGRTVADMGLLGRLRKGK